MHSGQWEFKLVQEPVFKGLEDMLRYMILLMIEILFICSFYILSEKRKKNENQFYKVIIIHNI